MPELLSSRFEAWRGRRLWLLGAGNAERSDDGFGVRLAEALNEKLGDDNAPIRVVDVGMTPERYVGMAVQAGCQELVFADAVDFGGAPGALLLAGTADLAARPVATSTHRVPLAVLAQYAEGLGARAWVLGVQPGSLAPGTKLSPEVAGTLEALVQLLGRALGSRGPEPGTRGPACFDRLGTSGDGGVES